MSNFPEIRYDYPFVYWMAAPSDDHGYLAAVVKRNEKNLSMIVFFEGGMRTQRNVWYIEDPEITSNTPRSRKLIESTGVWRTPAQEQQAQDEKRSRDAAKALRDELQRQEDEKKRLERQAVERATLELERAKKEQLLHEAEVQRQAMIDNWEVKEAEDALDDLIAKEEAGV